MEQKIINLFTDLQKEQKFSKLFFFSLLLIFFTVNGCGKQEKDAFSFNFDFGDCNETCNMPYSDGIGSYDCHISSFLDGISMYAKCSNTYLVKGSVLNAQEDYGLQIKLIEDLKGNFPKDIQTFTVWGKKDDCLIAHDRCDNLKFINQHQTLMMLLTNAGSSIYSLSEHCFETPDDYTTLWCTCSVLELSIGKVTGYIVFGRETMSCEDFQTKMNEVLNQQK